LREIERVQYHPSARDFNGLYFGAEANGLIDGALHILVYALLKAHVGRGSPIESFSTGG
jgi:hypothetical protein